MDEDRKDVFDEDAEEPEGDDPLDDRARKDVDSFFGSTTDDVSDGDDFL